MNEEKKNKRKCRNKKYEKSYLCEDEKGSVIATFGRHLQQGNCLLYIYLYVKKGVESLKGRVYRVFRDT